MIPRSVAFALFACVVLPRPLAAIVAFFSLCCSGSPRVVVFGSVGVFAVLWPVLFCLVAWLSVTLSSVLFWDNSPSSRPRGFYLPSGELAPRRAIPALSAAAHALPTLGGVSSCAVDPSCGGVKSTLPVPPVASSDGLEVVVAPAGAVVPCSVAPVVSSSGDALSFSAALSSPSPGGDSVLDSILPMSGGAELEALEFLAEFENDFLAFGDEILAAFAVPPAVVDAAPLIGDAPVAVPDALEALDGVLVWEDWVQDFPAAPSIGDADALFEGLLDFGDDVPPLPETPEEFGDAAPTLVNGWPDALAAPLNDVTASSSDQAVSSASASLPLPNSGTGSAVVAAATPPGSVLPHVFGDDFRAAWLAVGLPTGTVDALAHVVDRLGMPPPMPVLPDEMVVDGPAAPPLPPEGLVTPAPVAGGSVQVVGAGAPYLGFGPQDVIDEDVFMGNVEEDDRARVDIDDPMGIQGDVAMVHGRGAWRRRATHVHGGVMARPLGVPASRYAGPYYVRQYKGSPSWSW